MLIEATWEKEAGGVRIGTQECQEWTPALWKIGQYWREGHYIMEQADNHNTNSFQRRKIHAAQLLAFLAEKGSLTKEFVAPIDQEIWSLQCIFNLKTFYESRMDWR